MDFLKLLTRAQVLGVVRHVLTTVAGIAITNGYLDSETAVQFTGWAVAGVSIVWSILSKPTTANEPEKGP